MYNKVAQGLTPAKMAALIKKTKGKMAMNVLLPHDTTHVYVEKSDLIDTVTHFTDYTWSMTDREDYYLVTADD
jgi:hypothetical protein